jgi:4-amino-4-deoxy-L-arabinose transferase-like glycosyltransferase
MLTRSRLRIPLIAALATFGLHLVGNPHYGYFRDELYLIICGQRPGWGYVDQPPVTPLLSAASQIFGHSLVLLRALPAFFAAAAVYTTCLLAEELGGGAFAQVLGALTVFFAPVLMNFGMKVSPDTVGLWLWPLAALYTLRLAKGADPRGWLAVGAAMGICIESKYAVVFFIVAMLLGLLLTPERRILFSRWFLAGCGVGGLIALPNFLWQVHYGFPTLEFLRNAEHGKNLIVGPAQYLFQQLLLTNVFLALVWIIGLVWLLWNARLRFLGYTYAILIAFMIVLHGKHYYPADVYPYLMAAGAVAIEAWTNRWQVLRPVVATAVIVMGLIFVPFALPILPEEQAASYTKWLLEALHVQRQALATEHQRLPSLPTDWADMHGWPQLAAVVGNVYQSLPPSDRAQAAIVAGNYGEAAAIDFFGRPYGLPPAISGHNQYYLWGTHGYSGNVIIDVAGDCGARQHLFQSSERAASSSAPWTMPYEDGIPIMVCRGIKIPLAELWPGKKSYR